MPKSYTMLLLTVLVWLLAVLVWLLTLLVWLRQCNGYEENKGEGHLCFFLFAVEKRSRKVLRTTLALR